MSVICRNPNVIRTHTMYNNGGVDAAYGVHNYPQSRNKKPRPQNCGSATLTLEENKLLFSILGNDCISLAAAVCQLYRADNGRWNKIVTGVVCLIKDYNRRVYVIRMFDLEGMQIPYEQVLYRFFRVNYDINIPKFMSFEGDVAVYGLNFTADYEAKNFHYHIQKRYEQETKSKV
uniref:WH1 domain-containing protein n=1 Tax=Panagrolaimus sp. ES5 TaxID=591445 RepID=A0AC34GX30_9BILA